MAATLYLNNSKELDLLLGYLHLPPKAIEISKKRRCGNFGNKGPAFQNGDVLTSGIQSTSKALIEFATSIYPDAKLLLALNDFDKAQVLQWVQYYDTNLKPAVGDFQAMQSRAEELNDHLSTQTFVAGNRLSLADLLIFQSIHAFVCSMSFQDKERFIHVSRWFDNIQNTPRARHKLPKVHFHKTQLYI